MERIDHPFSRKTVAQSNPSPRWPQGYFEVLEELGVPPKHRGFYAHWVRQFFNEELNGRHRRDLSMPGIEHFLSVLRRDPGAQSWQADQAREALEIYYEQFRGISLAAPPPSLPSAAKPTLRLAGHARGRRPRQVDP